jgi:uncharacterized membrane protein YebE (DUF533 family)
MFNAKSLLDALINAGSQAGTQAGQQGGLGGMLGGLADQVQRSGGIGGLAGQILTQATQGLGDAARQTGVQQGAGEALGRVTGGRTPDQLIEQAKGMFAATRRWHTAVLGGLGALVLCGTSTGRSVAGSAAKLGGLALIGGLAYKAYQNYQAGKPLLNAAQQEVPPAPAGTGFEPQAATEATALVFIRAMIAAAAADGHIDAEERSAILGGLKEAGLEQEAHAWLAQEMAKPASIDTLVEAAESSRARRADHTAARIAINPDNAAEGLSRWPRRLARPRCRTGRQYRRRRQRRQGLTASAGA